MSVYAVVKDNLVVNAIEADSMVIAQLVLQDIDGEIIEQTDSTELAFIGSEFRNGKFVPVKPYESWIFDESTWTWTAPIPYPVFPVGKRGVWNESTGQWDEDDLPPMLIPSQV